MGSQNYGVIRSRGRGYPDNRVADTNQLHIRLQSKEPLLVWGWSDQVTGRSRWQVYGTGCNRIDCGLDSRPIVGDAVPFGPKVPDRDRSDSADLSQAGRRAAKS